MSGAKFDVVFRGVIAGFTRTQVQVALVKLFAQNAAKVVELFNAPSAYIKKKCK